MIRQVGVLLVLLGIYSCASLPEQRVTATLTDHRPLLGQSPAFKEFLKMGPFKYRVEENYSIRVSSSILIYTDLFIPSSETIAPLVIIQHGNRANKDVHRLQAEHLASWGFHVITVQQPNRNQWIANGHRLAQLVQLLQKWPRIYPEDFDFRKIILAGHSFGGSAAAIAGSQSDVAGVIFLDPAMYNNEVKSFLKSLNKPSMLLAADRNVFYSKKRILFHKLPAGGSTQVALRNTTHEDAQYPSLTENTFLLDPFTDDGHQHQFMAALTASAFSLIKQGDFRFAWDIMRTHQARTKQSFFGFRRRGE